MNDSSTNSSEKLYPNLMDLEQQSNSSSSSSTLTQWLRHECSMIWNDISSLLRSSWVRRYLIIGCATGAVMIFINLKNMRWVSKNMLGKFSHKSFTYNQDVAMQMVLKRGYYLSSLFIGVPFNAILSAAIWPVVWLGTLVNDVGISQARLSVPFYGTMVGICNTTVFAGCPHFSSCNFIQ